ncbi:YihY/virulence factor BrkB family protein [Sphingomonas morindae]|uniref:YihY/virulence factor BrkB family protein n=1 Tax=Sphingomonas morindae TaxID=1541170 RepID=A0ABY4X7R2_9SPHN|nr:YihY/virulence factor BrkB family protein [Sphingomonas morindae]USI72885.1 YihY/virulence factor BrkB family protein [Sphingomonas morindae]
MTTAAAMQNRTADDRGKHANTPTEIPAKGWRDVLVRAWKEGSADNISLVASGVAFCAVLALVPMLGAVVLSYGLVASPESVIHNVQAMTSVMPGEAAKLIGEQLMNVVTTSGGKKGFGLLVALLISLYGAMKGAGAIITALNIAYDEEETRGFVRVQLVTLAITVGAVLLAIVATVAIAALGHLDTLLPGAPGWVLVLAKLATYVVMAGGGAAAAATLYRYAPNRDEAEWKWLSAGSVGATLAWLAATTAFGIYVANFGSYDATYGSLGAAVVLLTWLYLSAYILLLGAEVNCELERQTAKDTTVGVEQPLGTRGAHAADTVAGERETANRNSGLEDGGGVGSQVPADGLELRNYLTARASGRAARLAGLPKVGMLSSVLATGGLAMLRQKGSARIGGALLATAAVLSWVRRQD